MTARVTIADALEGARKILATAGIPNPRLEARLLAGHVLGTAVEMIMGYPERQVAPARKADLEALVARRAGREPLAQILGYREFWSLPFSVNAHTLVPRPDTECVVAAALDWIGAKKCDLRILDLGTGSGCILLSLLSELPRARGLGVDISLAALHVARSNAISLGLGERADFVQGDWTSSLNGCFDIVVCNPPYIAEYDLADLAPEVARFEPRLALSGGADGLAAYRAVIPRLGRLLDRRAAAFFEIGAGAAEAVTKVLRDHGFELIEIKDDFASIPRCVRVVNTI